MEDRRRAQRQSTVWLGICHVEGESPDGVEGQSSRLWRGGGVFDFSTLGVGMDFRHPYPSDLVGRRITVRLPVGGSFDITFTGEVRNTESRPRRSRARWHRIRRPLRSRALHCRPPGAQLHDRFTRLICRSSAPRTSCCFAYRPMSSCQTSGLPR